MRNGSTLVEVVIAVGVAIVGLVALTQIGTKSINNTGFSTRQAQATAYASQALENVRKIKEKNGWTAIPLSQPCEEIGENLEFRRCVTYSFVNTPGKPAYVTVNVVVSWSEGGRVESAKLQTVLSRY